MREHDSGGKQNRNIWAPWRMEYIETLSDSCESGGGCFLCRAAEQGDRQQENLVVWRGQHCLTVLNRYPYTGGHAMVAPVEHVGDMEALDDATLLEMMHMVVDFQKVLQRAVHSQNFNIGINIGRAAGAGLPGHLHVHIVPRWGGDTNFMDVLGDVRVIPVSLEDIYKQITATAAQMGLGPKTE
ncbi:MAG: HIT domain-containing protein [Planctomycetaceae bacterium]|nr:HIT domain-containing protein [Planctomycetaceae bacterium]